jgi:hypothetical protein
MRVFSAGLRSSFHPWAKAGPLKEPRSRWTGIPRYPEHRQQPHRKLGAKYLVVLCAGSTLLLIEDALTSVVNSALVGVSQS